MFCCMFCCNLLLEEMTDLCWACSQHIQAVRQQLEAEEGVGQVLRFIQHQAGGEIAKKKENYKKKGNEKGWWVVKIDCCKKGTEKCSCGFGMQELERFTHIVLFLIFTSDPTKMVNCILIHTYLLWWFVLCLWINFTTFWWPALMGYHAQVTEASGCWPEDTGFKSPPHHGSRSSFSHCFASSRCNG